MFSVIIYALRVDYEFIDEYKEISSRLDKLLSEFNLQDRNLCWRVSDDMFWLSITRNSG